MFAIGAGFRAFLYGTQLTMLWAARLSRFKHSSIKVSSSFTFFLLWVLGCVVPFKLVKFLKLTLDCVFSLMSVTLSVLTKVFYLSSLILGDPRRVNTESLFCFFLDPELDWPGVWYWVVWYPAPAGVAPHVITGGEGGVPRCHHLGGGCQTGRAPADTDRAGVSQVGHWGTF